MSGAVVDARAEASVGKTPVDLRQVGAHPDYWYPVAWSHEVKRGQVVASSFRIADYIAATTAGAMTRRENVSMFPISARESCLVA